MPRKRGGTAVTPVGDQLKEQHRAVRHNMTQDDSTRLHRSISWFRRAEQITNDGDARFLFLWIAFNSAYAHEFSKDDVEMDSARQFIDKLIALDSEQQLAAWVRVAYSGPIRNVINNKFLFTRFWNERGTTSANASWVSELDRDAQASFNAAVTGDVSRAMRGILSRLYVLRNQVVHGGATWNSKVNRPQIQTCTTVLMQLMPIIIGLMMHPDARFDPIAYPRLDD